MKLAMVVLIAMPALLPAAASELAVCLENTRTITPGALTAFQSSLRELGPQIGAAVSFRCEDLRPPFLLVSLRDNPRPSQPENALASLLTQSGRIVPRMELYVQPVRRMMPSRLELMEGRALAWVAGHELLHFLQGRLEHDHRGWFAAEVSAAMLMLPPSAYKPK